METGGGGGFGDGNNRRRLSLNERTNSSNNLRGKDTTDGNNNGGRQNLTLTADKKLLNRTLLDIIRDDDSTGDKDHKKSWKHFRDTLRLRRAGVAWASSVYIPTSDVPVKQTNNRMITRRHSTRIMNTNEPISNESTHESTQQELSSATHAEFNRVTSNRAISLRRHSSFILERQNSRLITTNEDSVPEDEIDLSAEEVAGETEEEEEMTMAEREGERRGEGRVRISLMSLLAESDRQMGLEGLAYMIDDDEEEEGEDGGGGEYNNCSVCMVRHKGAAFIPCGHTFCRLCSRELWVQRGNCPVCNGFILEILDIF
ncbi:unnamed protein product [Ilex paraguariensis]|uniref:RING-type domain-containing protein n=1 Tax=Ilex paraguariensis TaxID=185542 RepID=A0ABC8TKY5_9AQUA